MRPAAAAALVLFLGACGGASTLPCGPKDAACAVASLKDHRAKRAESWKEAFARPVEERIGPAPPFLVELVALDNIAHQYPNKPRAAAPDAAFLDDVRAAVAGMPEGVRRKVAPKLAGIYFVDDLGSSGFADGIRSAKGPVGGFIVLDPTVLRNHTANSWSTWRDGSPFRSDPSWRLESVLARPGEDTRVAAIRYLLLHEFAHVLAVGEAFHPDWMLTPREVASTEGYPYFAISWIAGSEKFRTPFDRDFPERSDIVYYFGARLAGDRMARTYEGLEKTSFPTLYAATHPADDFAEAFANYVHTRLLGQPFEIRLLKDGEVAKTYRDCWDEPRCAAKRAILERYLDVR